MNELKGKKPVVTETDVEAVIRRESEDALRRFRAGDFAAHLKSRLEAPPVRQPFSLFRKPVFIPALGLLVLAAGALIVFFAPGRGNNRVEAGFRFMTESLARTDLFRAGGLRVFSGSSAEAATGQDTLSFARALFQAAARPEAAPSEGGAPLRPLFSPKERFKILYGDRAILRVLMNIANQKEV